MCRLFYIQRNNILVVVLLKKYSKTVFSSSYVVLANEK